MVKPIRGEEVIKKNKVIGSEWKVRGKKNNLSKREWQKWRKKNHMEGMGGEKKNNVTSKK
jgi:hypothetical protein